MSRLLLAVAVVVAIPLSASAQNVGKCGWGSKVFDGQSGIAPQILAVTTNGVVGNQTFAISTGTSGCTQDGVVRSGWKTALFIKENQTKIARDMSVGEGEALASLATLLGMNTEDRVAFYQVSKDNFQAIFPRNDVSSDEVIASLKTVLADDTRLAAYSNVM